MVVNANTDQLVGHVLRGRYRLVQLLAQGGMAVVYRGHDLQLDRPVAVKVPRARFASDASFAAQFDREARVAARLNHPAIVAVHDSGQDHSIPYIVMEYVDGQSLRDLLTQRGRLGLEATAEVIGAVAAALDHAHTHRVAHLDIKPENVLVTHGSVKVVDFGLVRALRTVAPHAAAGTEAYLAPEAQRGEAVSGSVDIYALGVMAIECLVGAVPAMSARGNEHSLALAHLPRVARETLARATDPDVQRRPPLALDLATALGARPRQLLGNSTVTGMPTGTTVMDTTVLGTTVLGTTVLEDVSGSTAVLRETDAAAAGFRHSTTIRGHGTSTRVLSREPAHPTSTSPVGARPMLRQSSKRPSPGPRTRGRGWRRGTVSIALVLFVLTIGTFLATQSIATSPRTTVPSVLGLSTSAARESLGAAQLRAVQGPAVHSFSVTAGDVVGQSQPSGARLTRGAAVVFMVSAGPPRATVPSVVGDTEALAHRALDGARLHVALRHQPSRTVPIGNVVNQKPAAGDSVPQASVVTLTVSSGPARVRVPSVVGLSRRHALHLLRHLGLHGSFGFWSLGPTVVTQSPAPGQFLPQGARVHLTTSALP